MSTGRLNFERLACGRLLVAVGLLVVESVEKLRTEKVNETKKNATLNVLSGWKEANNGWKGIYKGEGNKRLDRIVNGRNDKKLEIAES